MDDCHDRMERWCSSCANVLTVLQHYEKFPEYTGHTGDVGQYELAISGFSTKTKVTKSTRPKLKQIQRGAKLFDSWDVLDAREKITLSNYKESLDENSNNIDLKKIMKF